MSYLILLLSAFGAATILPLASEATLLYFIEGGGSIVGLWCIATLGNTAGACVNWWIGLNILRFRERSWFPVSASQLEKGQLWFRRYGLWTLLLSWLPVIGDAFTVAAGVAKVHLSVFVLLVLIAKGLRYAAVIALYLGLW